MSGVVVFGDVCIETASSLTRPLVPGSGSPEVLEMGIGGFAGATAAWLGRLGTPAVLLGSVGDDAQGQFLIAAAARGGISADALHTVAGRRTASTISLHSPDGAVTRLVDAGVSAELTLDDRGVRAIQGADALIASLSTYLQPETRDVAVTALSAAREADTVVIMDCADAGLILETSPMAARRYLDQVDIVLANDDEIGALTSDQPPGWLGSLPNLVITHGAGGATWWSHGAPSAKRAAAEGIMVDPSGAAAAFAAGVVSLLARGGDLAEPRNPSKAAALEHGLAIAARCCAHIGAWPR